MEASTSSSPCSPMAASSPASCACVLLRARGRPFLPAPPTSSWSVCTTHLCSVPTSVLLPATAQKEAKWLQCCTQSSAQPWTPSSIHWGTRMSSWPWGGSCPLSLIKWRCEGCSPGLGCSKICFPEISLMEHECTYFCLRKPFSDARTIYF